MHGEACDSSPSGSRSIELRPGWHSSKRSPRWWLAGQPPIRDKSVDVVLVSQLAHHLHAESVICLFQCCNRLARRAVIVSDLRRHPLATASFRFGGRLLGFDPVTLSDGVTSIRRGFSRRELLDLMDRAGITGEVAYRPGFRLVATWIPESG